MGVSHRIEQEKQSSFSFWCRKKNVAHRNGTFVKIYHQHCEWIWRKRKWHKKVHGIRMSHFISFPSYLCYQLGYTFTRFFFAFVIFFSFVAQIQLSLKSHRQSQNIGLSQTFWNGNIFWYRYNTTANRLKQPSHHKVEIDCCFDCQILPNLPCTTWYFCLALHACLNLFFTHIFFVVLLSFHLQFSNENINKESINSSIWTIFFYIVDQQKLKQLIHIFYGIVGTWCLLKWKKYEQNKNKNGDSFLLIRFKN